MEITVQPIRNEADSEAGLPLAETLMDAEPGTPEGDHLDVLVTLIEAFEARECPIPAPDPIEAIRARVEQRGLRPRDLADLQ